MKKIQFKKLPVSISLVIPVFNNESTIYKQLTDCIIIMNKLCKAFEIIISNDASQDKTKEILEKHFERRKNIIIVHQKKNQGISRNIKFLYKKARFEYILLFSIDGGWDPQDIKSLTYKMFQTKSDIVIGKRKTKNYSYLRSFISSMYNNLPYLLFGVQTHDAGSIKIFKRDIFLRFPLKSKSIFFEAEMIIRASKKKNAYLPRSSQISNYKKTKKWSK